MDAKITLKIRIIEQIILKFWVISKNSDIGYTKVDNVSNIYSKRYLEVLLRMSVEEKIGQTSLGGVDIIGW